MTDQWLDIILIAGQIQSYDAFGVVRLWNALLEQQPDLDTNGVEFCYSFAITLGY